LRRYVPETSTYYRETESPVDFIRAEKGVVTRTIMLEAAPQFGCERVVLALSGDA
jgi:hypothetical protein